MNAQPEIRANGGTVGKRGALLGTLAALDQVLERGLRSAAHVYGWESGATQFRGLYISHSDLERIFARQPGEPALGDLRDASSSGLNDISPFDSLARRYQLDWFDCATLLVALAPEIDLRYERIYAYLQDDVSRRRPSVDLILNLFCASSEEKMSARAYFGADAPLRRHRLIQLVADPAQTEPPLLAHSVRLDNQVLRELLESSDLDSRLSATCRPIRSGLDLASLPLEPGCVERLRSLALRAQTRAYPLRLWFRGARMPLHQLTAEALAHSLDRQLLRFDLSQVVRSEGSAAEQLQLAVREAEFFHAVLLIEVEEADERLGAILARAFSAPAVDLVVATPALPATMDALALIAIDFPRASYGVAREQWHREVRNAGGDLSEAELDSLTGRFSLYPDQIGAAVAAARSLAWWRGDQQPAAADLSTAARTQSGRQIATVARKVEARYGWKDIVLPPGTVRQLRSICARVAHRHRVLEEWGFGRRLSMGKGATGLFAGPSGVGKTMAAEVIANELDIDLYKIDLSSVVSKYIGETEKNLERIFDAAENANAILFFDEADALFGKRSEVKDSHDRYANIEISYLLQKMEAYEGVAILASNLRQNLDDSFLRRLAFIVHFPFPDEAHRRRIWDAIWPEEIPLESHIDFDFLASQFKLSGGNIKNVALAAAFLAAEEGTAVAMPHLITAVEREYQKMGKPLAPEQFHPLEARP